jgi:hypothetical protein
MASDQNGRAKVVMLSALFMVNCITMLGMNSMISKLNF